MKNFLLGLSLLIAGSQLFAKGNIEKGEALAGTCVACHGEAGNSGVANFPKLAGQNAKYIKKQLVDMTTDATAGGRPVPEMTAIIAGFSEQDLDDLAAYYESQVPTGGAAKDQNLALGEQIYRGGIADKQVSACSGCHSPLGLGNKGAGYPSLSGQHADYLVKQLKAFRLGADQPAHPEARINDTDARIMRSIAERMSDLEIEAVANYLQGLRAP